MNDDAILEGYREHDAGDVVRAAHIHADDPAAGLGDLIAARVSIRDLRADLAQLERDLDARIISAITASGERKTVVEGIGQVEVRYSKRRTGWDHERLVPAVVARLVDDPTTLYDPETGELLPPAAIGQQVASRLRDCVSFGAGKVTGLKAIGLDPEEFCEADPAHASVVLPPREA